MKATPVQEVAGPYLFEPSPHVDERAFPCRTFDGDMVRLGWHRPCRVRPGQHVAVRQSVLRGMHLRSGAGEAKLVSCSFSEVFDVIVERRLPCRSP